MKEQEQDDISKLQYLLEHWDKFKLKFEYTSKYNDNISTLMMDTFTKGKGSMPLSSFNETKTLCLYFYNLETNMEEIVIPASDKLLEVCINDSVNNFKNVSDYAKMFIEQTLGDLILKKI